MWWGKPGRIIRGRRGIFPTFLKVPCRRRGLNWCQTLVNSLIYRSIFGNYVRVTDVVTDVGRHSEVVPVAIQGAVLDSLGDMLRRDGLEARQVGQGASHLENAVVSTS